MEVSLKNRADAVALFLDTIRPLKPFYSPHHAFLYVGNTGVHYGEKSARMEGFARILWGLGPLWSADNSSLDQKVQQEIEEWFVLYRDGILHGVDPEDEEYWADIFDFDQKMVEVAALVFTIAINQQRLWYDLSPEDQKRLYTWLNQMNDYDMPTNNWRYFRILTNMTFQLLGLPWSEARMKEDFDLIESCYTGDGWYYDGNPTQIDYYVAFAIHYYGLIYAHLMEEREPERCRILKERSTQFYGDFVYWFAGNGEEIPFGRSLTYRYAHCSPFAAMAYAELDVDYGVLKNLVLRNLEIWMRRPVFDNSGVLSIGYGYPNLFMSEHYNGCGSPYWCNKAFLILGLNEDHPFWTSEPKVYPYEKTKFLPHPHMIVQHDSHDHVLAYVTGQHCKQDHGQGAAKYEKFVYSNQFGFSVSRGLNLADGAFDSTLAISVKGEDRYCMRRGFESFAADPSWLSVRYRPISGVEIESIIVPCTAPWHVRIHKIVNDVAVDTADGSFALPQEHCFQLTSGRKTGRYDPADVHTGQDGVTAAFPWGVSCIFGESGQEPELVVASPNTNLLYNLTVIPTVKKTLEPGLHVLVSCAAADFHQSQEELLASRPQVQVGDEEVVITAEEKEIRISL